MSNNFENILEKRADTLTQKDIDTIAAHVQYDLKLEEFMYLYLSCYITIITKNKEYESRTGGFLYKFTRITAKELQETLQQDGQLNREDAIKYYNEFYNDTINTNIKI